MSYILRANDEKAYETIKAILVEKHIPSTIFHDGYIEDNGSVSPPSIEISINPKTFMAGK